MKLKLLVGPFTGTLAAIGARRFGWSPRTRNLVALFLDVQVVSLCIGTATMVIAGVIEALGRPVPERLRVIVNALVFLVTMVLRAPVSEDEDDRTPPTDSGLDAG